MKRGDIFSATGSGFAAKPRPVVVIQRTDTLPLRDSVTACLVSSDLIDAPSFRVRVKPSAGSGLRAVSEVMADKVVTIRKSSFGQKIGALSQSDMGRLDEALRFWIDLP